MDWLPGEEVERRAFEQEKRDFGLDLVRRLELVAVADVRGRDAAYLEQRINFLLKLCDWLSTEHGYGNHYVSQWTINIALNSMAVLALDEKVPTTTVRSLMARLPSKKTTLRFRLDVLNSEAPHRFSLPLVLMDCAEGNR